MRIHKWSDMKNKMNSERKEILDKEVEEELKHFTEAGRTIKTNEDYAKAMTCIKTALELMSPYDIISFLQEELRENNGYDLTAAGELMLARRFIVAANETSWRASDKMNNDFFKLQGDIKKLKEENKD